MVYDVRKLSSNTPAGEAGNPVLEFVQYIRPQAAALTVAWNPRKHVRSSPCVPCDEPLHPSYPKAPTPCYKEK